jgi:hypothetical protein
MSALAIRSEDKSNHAALDAGILAHSFGEGTQI